MWSFSKVCVWSYCRGLDDADNCTELHGVPARVRARELVKRLLFLGGLTPAHGELRRKN